MSMRFISSLWDIREKGVLGFLRLVSLFSRPDLRLSSGASFTNTPKAPQDREVLPHRNRREEAVSELA